MYPTAAVLRMFTKGRRLLVPWLLVCLCAASASAAPRARRHAGRRHPVATALTPASCSTTLTLRALQRQSRAVAGPVAHRSTSLHSDLPHPTRLVQRGTPDQFGETGAAIANDAPVAHIDVDRRVRPGFRALGVLACSVDRLPASVAYPPLSSRGPPFQV
jgi:hypothetical protein